MKNIKIFVLGGQGVGKTSIIHQVLFGPSLGYNYQRMPKCNPTIEDVYFATIDLQQIASNDNQRGHQRSYHHRDDRLLFFDVAGETQNIDIESLRNNLALADDFILVYSINDRASFNLVDTIKKLIDQCKGRRDQPIIVLGNKLDLDVDRQIDFNEAHIWAKREQIKLFEVTATERETLNDFMTYLASRFVPNQAHSISSFKLRRSKTTTTGP